MGLAHSEAVGIGSGGAVTVTFAVAVTEPVALVATSEYIVVVVGDTVCELPLTAAPLSLTVVAFDVVHESVAELPL